MLLCIFDSSVQFHQCASIDQRTMTIKTNPQHLDTVHAVPFCGTTWCAIRVRVRSCELNLKRDVANGEQNSITPTPGALRVTFFSAAHRRMKAILAEFRFDLVIRPWMDFSHLLLAKRENQPINVQSTLVGQTRSKKRNPPQLDLHSHTLKHTHTSYHRCRYSDVWCDGDGGAYSNLTFRFG